MRGQQVDRSIIINVYAPNDNHLPFFNTISELLVYCNNIRLKKEKTSRIITAIQSNDTIIKDPQGISERFREFYKENEITPTKQDIDIFVFGEIKNWIKRLQNLRLLKQFNYHLAIKRPKKTFFQQTSRKLLLIFWQINFINYILSLKSITPSHKI